ncbi:hypothetical protein HDU76_010509, partial [Blyttiomyces sp. JEL0837]
MVLGQTKRRLATAFAAGAIVTPAITTTAASDPAAIVILEAPEISLPAKMLVAAIAGSAQAALALYLKSPSALEKRPEETLLVLRSRTDFWGALKTTVLRNAAGYVAFFLIWDALKVAASKAKGRSLARTAQNIGAASLAAVGYRATTWLIDGRMPSEANSEQGGKRGGNPYEPA